MIRTARIKDIYVEPFDRTRIVSAEYEYSLFNPKRVIANYELMKETFWFTIQEDVNNFPYPERLSELGISGPWYTAVDCLGGSLFAPAVLFASISVESALNHDMRLDAFRTSKDDKAWISLSWRNLRYANEVGLPTKLLLDEGESFDKECKIRFAERRNKIAHGDFQGFSNIKSEIGDLVLFGPKPTDTQEIPAREPNDRHAIDQINKARQFLIEWARQKPELRLHT